MSEKRPWYYRLVKKNDQRIVLICIGIALILWMTTKLSQNYTHDYRFSMIYDLPENVSFMRMPQARFEARLSGQGWELLQASMRRGFSKVHVPVRRGDITGTDLVQALYQHLGDMEIQVREVDVDVIPIDTDITIRKSVPIRYTYPVRFAEGLQIKDSLIIDPPVAILTGPAALCEDIEVINVPDQDIPELQADFSKTVELNSPDPLITVSPSRVEMKVGVDPMVDLDFTIPLEIVGDTSALSQNVASVRVRCVVGQSNQDRTNPGLFQAIVSINEECIAAGRCTVDISAPSFARNVTVEPAFLEVGTQQNGQQ